MLTGYKVDVLSVNLPRTVLGDQQPNRQCAHMSAMGNEQPYSAEYSMQSFALLTPCTKACRKARPRAATCYVFTTKEGQHC